MKRARPLLLASLVFLLLVPLSRRASAELLWSETGFFVDLPEGFSLGEGDGKTRFAFTSPDSNMEFDILVYDASRYPGAEACAADVLKKLGSTGERETYAYQGRNSVFAELVFSPGGRAKKGYAAFIGPRTGARPGQTGQARQEPTIALLAWTDAARLVDYSDFIFSCVDAFSIDKAALRAPGPVSQYLLAWPATRAATKKVLFGKTELLLPWSAEEASQEEELAGREFRVLQAYANTQDQWQPAWARAYRMIYRESAPRLDRLAAELDRLLPDDPTEAARQILFWTQGFTYERDLKGIDFVDPLSSAYEARGDCDSRAMVAAIILERRGIDSILMVSDAYAHAMLGVDVPGGGQRFPFEGKDYLVGETTAKVGLGMISADQKDWSKWMGIQLGDQAGP
jgi:hypothetical protein